MRRRVRSCLVAVAFGVVAAGCSTQVIAPPVPQVPTADPAPVAQLEGIPSEPTGTVRVAYPDPVGTWWQASEEDLAAGDLAALWSLPLHRTDPLGRPVPALAVASTVVADEPSWTVEVTLAAGTWSDGRPVTARDVVATTRVLRASRPAQWAAFVGAEAVDDDTVRLRFDRPYAGWSALLSAPPGVLPAHVLEDGGLEAYASALPVTGGAFTLTSAEPGLRATFVAHPGSPLGAPVIDQLDVVVVPDHEVSLGLLAAGDVDAVVGHVALDPAARRALVPGAVGEAVFGGTRFELLWEPGATDVVLRRRVASDLDVTPFVEGLLRDVGREAGGVLPVLASGPAAADGSDDVGGEVEVQVVRTVEGLGLLARRLQTTLSAADVTTTLVGVDPPEHLAEPVDVDGRLRLVRVGPQRSAAALLSTVGLDPADGVAADAEGLPDVDPVGPRVAAEGPHARVAAALVDDPLVLPLAEVAVAHVWAPDRVTGITPSGWPGLGFWSAATWSVPVG